MNLAVFCAWALCVAGLMQSALMLLFGIEHWRYHRSRRLSRLSEGTRPRVLLFVPCKGVDAEMDVNLQALFEQDYGPLELCFIVESQGDPAVAVIERLRARYVGQSARVVVAGMATACGQKVHNLIAGTIATASSKADVFAFVDSDARPKPEALARLVSRLERGKIAISTGYRWYVPQEPTFANRLLSAINNTIVALLGSHGFNLVWGGAWAIRRETFARLGLPEAWRGSLSDDLVVSRLAHEARLIVAYEPHCLAHSPADFGWRSLVEFLRRQYRVARVYAPRWWRSAVAFGTLTAVVATVLPTLVAWLAISGGPWLPIACGTLAIYAVTACRMALAARAVKPFVTVSAAEFRSVAAINAWLWPLVSLFTWMALIASAAGRTIVWRGTTYVLESASCTRILNREGVQTSGNPTSSRAANAA